jgi:hypothetical protein
MLKTVLFCFLVIITLILSFSAVLSFLFLNDYGKIKETIAEKIASKISTIISQKVNASVISIENVKELCDKGFEFPEDIAFLSNACEDVKNNKIKTIPELMKAIGNLTVAQYFKPLDDFVKNFSPLSLVIYILFFIFYIVYLFFIFVYGKNESMLLFFIIAVIFLATFHFILSDVVNMLFFRINKQIALLLPSEFMNEVIKFLYEIKIEIVDGFILNATLITSFLILLPIVGNTVYNMAKIKMQQSKKGN